MSSAGCIAACLNTAGRGVFNNVQQARIRKTQWLVRDRAGFMAQLRKDLDAVVRKAIRLKLKPVVRLNGTSDIDWSLIKLQHRLNIFQLYPDIQFYDYTKVYRRLEALIPPNYDLTFSRSENNETECRKAIAKGFNVAVVFSGAFPRYFLNGVVIDGDSHDLRFLDPKKFTGRIVALKAKGKAKRDSTGFVVRS